MMNAKHRPLLTIGAAIGLAAALCACDSRNPAPEQAPNATAAPEPLPPPENLAADAELANEAAEAEALDAQIGGNQSGAEPNMQ
jgi:hypothetical protein